MKRLLLFAIALALFADHSLAQVVHGTVTESDRGTPLAGAFVVLLDTAGVQRGATLTDAEGRFVLRARTGRFKVRAELIGHQSVTSPFFVVPASGPVVSNVVLPIAPIELEAVSVAGDRRCRVRPESGAQTARLWEEARKALAVTSWAEKERVADFRTRTYDRELRLPSLTMVWETVRPEFSQVRPYRAVSPDSLAAFGFVRTISGDSTLYYGPDAEVLMSDVFLDTHCFQTRRGQDDARGLIGLSFEPVRGRSVPDIAGTLWLDPKTSKLEYIEFTYTGIPRNLNVAGVGGRTYFRRLPNGAWIVDRWYIRMPIPRRGWNDELVAHALLEGGGEITEVRVAGSALPRGAIRGIIYDSINNAALARALVYLSGTAHSAVTDSAGRFEIRDVPTGKHTIAFSHASFDSLPAWPPGRTVDVEADSEATVQLAVPSVASLVARVCPDAPNAGVIVGQVLDDRRELTDAVVVAKFRYQGRDRVVRARPGASGRYVLCGIPVAMRFALALNDDRPVPARMPEVGFMRVDYE